jgi:hypothetical protein
MFLCGVLPVRNVLVYTSLEHGGIREAGDAQITNECALNVPIKKQWLKRTHRLEDLLDDYFNHSVMKGLKRRVQNHTVEMDARVTMRLLASYDRSLPVVQDLMVPIVLKRYAFKSTTGIERMDITVKIPLKFNVTPYIVTGSGRVFWLELVSAVCFHGSSATAGHYITYLSRKEGWVQTNNSKAGQLAHAVGVGEMQRDLDRNGYVFLYHLIGS